MPDTLLIKKDIQMKDLNFFPGIYKAIAITICLMLYIAVHKANAGNVSFEKNIKTTSLLTNP
jgi:hypothetical protein